jgi:hypothetical protein
MVHSSAEKPRGSRRGAGSDSGALCEPERETARKSGGGCIDVVLLGSEADAGQAACSLISGLWVLVSPDGDEPKTPGARKRVTVHNPPPEIGTTPNVELLGTTTGMIVTAVAAVVGLAVLIGGVYWAAVPRPMGNRLRIPRRGEASGSGTNPEISPGQGDSPWEEVGERHVPEGGHTHGKPASWALVAVVLAAFTTGGLAIIVHAWWLMWTCAGICLLGIPAGKMVGIMDQTVSWGSTPAATNDSQRGLETDAARGQ